MEYIKHILSFSITITSKYVKNHKTELIEGWKLKDRIVNDVNDID